MKEYRVALMGMGNVGRRLLQLLREKAPLLDAEEKVRVRITGIATRSIGYIANAKGIGDVLPPANCHDLDYWLSQARPDVVFEATSSNPLNGEPAISHVRAALHAGAHVVTANKGITIHGWEEVQNLAARVGRKFLFEASVMGGAPIFSLFRETRPLTKVTRIRAVLNATTTVILDGLAEGLSFELAVRRAQELGVAETDPSADIDGWDAALKINALAKVLMKAPLLLTEVSRQGIREVTPKMVQEARAEGQAIRLVASAERWGDGVEARVRPEAVPLSDPLGAVSGTDLVLQVETDVVPSLTLMAKRGGPMATAYDMLADFVSIVRSS